MSSASWSRARRVAARLLFWGILIWPAVHAVASKAMGFSSWRLFGWGMYATPDGESLSALSVLWFPRGARTAAEYQELYHRVRREDRLPLTEDCFHALVAENTAKLVAVRTHALCRDPITDQDLSYLRQFHSLSHLVALVKRGASAIGLPPQSAAAVILSRQRLHVRSRTAYTENELFEVRGDRVRSLGRFD